VLLLLLLLCSQAWEYFLLRPQWLCKATSKNKAHEAHAAPVVDMQQAIDSLITLAKPAAGSLPADCFFAQLLHAQEQGQLTDKEVQQLVLEMILAGTDTSSVSLYYLLVQLQDEQLLDQELVEEVQQAAGA
jgi:aromatase